MSNFDKENGVLLNIRESSRINKFGFDGRNYYYTVIDENVIIKCDGKLNVLEIYPTINIYDNICYNSSSNSFFVNIVDGTSHIIELDANMKEMHKIELNVKGDKITGIGYNCERDNIIVSFSKIAYEIRDNKYIEIYSIENGKIMNIMSVFPYYFVVVITNMGQKIYLVDDRGKVIDSFDVECSIYVKNIVFNPCDEKNLCATLEYLAVNNRYEYMCNKMFCTFGIDENISECNYNICNECDRDIRPFKACKDVVESIAIIETSLGYILYQESEKLRKILENTNDIDKIMHVNKEINRTIVNVTNLEHILYNKLLAVLDKCDIC